MRDEPGAEKVEELFIDSSTAKSIHVINLIEVHYELTRVEGLMFAETTLLNLARGGVTVHRDLDEDFWKSVSSLKSRGRISLADCFCVVLATRLGGEVWTADRAEFQPLSDAGLCRTVFIR